MAATGIKKSVNWLRVILIVALTLGIVLRTVRILEIPPGLYRDEAYTGMDGKTTLAGDVRMFYPVSFGREPLFTWLVAGSIGIWGPTPFAARFPALVTGILTLLALYAAARELFGERAGVLATLVLAITLWHIVFSRVSFRAGLIPLFTALSVWQIGRGIKTGYARHWILGGAAAGTLLYTYIAARMAALPAVLMVLYTWWRQRSLKRPTPRELALFTLPALLVMAPFLIYALGHQEEVFLRTENVASIFNSPEPWAMLKQNILGALGMFLVRGDYLPRHNVPLRPVFDPALGAAFLIGLGLTMRRFKEDYAAAFLLFWTGALLLPTLLAEKCPHFIRGIGLLPFLAIYPALGLDWLWEQVKRRGSVLWATLAVSGIVMIGLGSTVWDYFVRYPALPELCYRFECEGTQLASEINAFLEAGWTQGNWFARTGTGRADRQVFVQYQLWKDVVNAHYLIPDTPGFNVPEAPEINSTASDPTLPTLYFGWNNRNYPNFWLADLQAWMPPDARIELTEGPPAITAQDKEPHPAYLKFYGTPLSPPTTLQAQLDEGLGLVDSCVDQDGQDLVVRLIWYNAAPVRVNYTVFVHYERDGRIIAQADAEPGLGYYPMTLWRPGDQFVDERRLPLIDLRPGDRIYTGLYSYMTGDRVPVLRATTPTQNDRIAVNLQPCES